MRKMSDKQLLELVVQLPSRSEDEGDELLADLLVHTYPTLQAQKS